MKLFTPEQWEHGHSVGNARIQRVRRNGYGPGKDESYRAADMQHKSHLIGAMAEKAYSIETGLDWPNDENEFGKGTGDFDGIAIRGTKWKTGSLIVFDSELESPALFVLVVIDMDERSYRIAGACYAHQAMELGNRPWINKIRENSPPQWWVSQENLEPV